MNKKKRKTIIIAIISTSAVLLIGFLIFCLTANSIIVDDCAKPGSCAYGPCPAVCVEITLWDDITGGK